MNSFSKTIIFLWETGKIVLIALLIIVPIRYFIAQPFFVSGESMSPTFSDGEYLIIDEISYRFSSPDRGDVIIFRYPEDPSQFFIKRIVGLPDEKIVIDNGEVTIFNNKNPLGIKLNESYLIENTPGNLEIKLDGKEYFVLGDNRDSSSDSRRWGPLPQHLIVGKVFIRAWPFGRVQAFSSPTY